MIRKIINIDQTLCNGCAKCVNACHEGAIKLVNGKATLIRDDYCDGLGDCLPHCPTGAITFTYREALEYNESLVLEAKSKENHQWPCQIKLLPVKSDMYENKDIAIVADCTFFAYKNIHTELIKDKIVLMGCSKLDDINYSEKLFQIIKNNNIKSITIIKMEVPCCNGIELATRKALKESNKDLSIKSYTISTSGRIIKEI